MSSGTPIRVRGRRRGRSRPREPPRRRGSAPGAEMNWRIAMDNVDNLPSADVTEVPEDAKVLSVKAKSNV